MLLNISNIKNIKNATLEFDGITVIVGENGTGKSTISKSLFSIFASLYTLNQDRRYLLKNEFAKILKKINFDYARYKDQENFLNILVDYRDKTKESFISDEEIYQSVTERLKSYIENIKYNNEYFNDTVKSIVDLIKKDNNIFNEQSVREYLISEFSDKIYNVKNNNYESKISIGFHYNGNGDKNDINSYKAKNIIKVSGDNYRNCFVNENENEFEPITNKIFYYDGLNVDFNLEVHNYAYNEFNLDLLRHTKDKGSGHKILFDREIIFDFLHDGNMIEEELNDLFSDFGDAGEVFYNFEEHKLLYKNNKFKSTISPNQLSQGLKGILVIRQLILKKHIEKEDLLILDEPEINLHPKWQIIYAELIVKLQKKYDLTILLCSHSPFFIKAIKIFSVKYDIKNKTRFYLSSNNTDGYSEINDVTQNIDLVFRNLAEPYFALSELEGRDDE